MEDKEFKDSLPRRKNPVVILFTSKNCKFLEEVQEFFLEVIEEYKDKIDFFRVEAEKSVLSKDLNIRGIPSLAYFLEGSLYRIDHFMPLQRQLIDNLRILLTPEAKRNLKFIYQIKKAINAEKILSGFYKYISYKTKNGRVRRIFYLFSEESYKHFEGLQDFLMSFNGEIFEPQEKVLFQEIGNPESFSTLGAMEMAQKLEEKASKFYKSMQDITKNKIFKTLSQEEKVHLRRLKEEISFLKKKKFLEKIDIQVEEKLFDGLFRF